MNALVKALVPVAVLAVIVLVLLSSMFVVVEAGHVGVVKRFGAVQPEPLAEGLHFKRPFVDEVDQIDMRLLYINAKATGTNAPLYSTLRTDATVAGGITGTISGLRPVHVPELDTHGSYAIVGPSSGFAWCEEGPLQLQADVPTLAGRDVALVGFVFFIPWYADAFTFYNVAS